MSDPESGKSAPRFRVPTWCGCRPRVLLCFGLPLLPPSATLLGVAYGFNQDFGVFHILGFVLIFTSVACITAAIFLTLYRKHSTKELPVKVTTVSDMKTPRQRPPSGGSTTTSNGIKLTKVKKLQSTSLVAESVPKSRHKKKKKEHRKHHRKTRNNLAPVKEEDGRARFEQSMKEREKQGKILHKRTKSESKPYFDNNLPGTQVQPAPVPGVLTKKHLKMLAILNNQGSQESLQRRRHSLSDLGDSASERMSIDLCESPRFSKRLDWDPPGSETARPVLINHSASRTGVRTSRFSSIL